MKPFSLRILDIINEKILEDNKKKYYVGKLEFNVSGVNPATYLGFGTWQLWGAGKVPVGIDASDNDFKTVEKTGGAKNHNHGNTGSATGNTGSTTLTINQIPAHSHKTSSYNEVGYQTGSTNRRYPVSASDTGAKANWNTAESGGGAGHTHTLNNHKHTTSDSSTLQPYITCYIWKRVS